MADFETKVIRGEACLRAARRLAEAGYRPDAIIAHPGWGESLFLLDLWPGVPLGLYSEFFYSEAGADVGFDPDFAPADPASFPEPFRSRISVIHDGIDTQRVHWLGRIPYDQFVDLTVPFVLSWSLLEAMSIGCAIVASDTEPVREVISHDHTGRLVNFFDAGG